jgi:hypothetical protein
MRKRTSGKRRQLIRVLILVAAVVLADRLLWPRYSRERHVDPDDAVATVLPNEACEVLAGKEPALLKRLVRALSSARSWIKYGIDWDQEIILHFRRGPPLVIRYGQIGIGKGGAYYFWGHRKYWFGERRLYRAAALGKVLNAIRASEQCRIRPIQIPPESVRELACFAGGVQGMFRRSNPRAEGVLAAVNGFLELVDTSCCGSLGWKITDSFYEGEATLETYLRETTGAILLLDPPLLMHTTVIFSHYPTLVEYHEFKTNTILLSEAISVYSSKVVGFSSNRKPNRFYFFPGMTPPRSPDRDLAAKRWNQLTEVLQSAVAAPETPPR